MKHCDYCGSSVDIDKTTKSGLCECGAFVGSKKQSEERRLSRGYMGYHMVPDGFYVDGAAQDILAQTSVMAV